MVVVIANGDREDLLSLLLLYDKPIEMRFNVARQEIEFEFVVVGLFRFFILFCCRLLRLGNRCDRDPIAEVRVHELRDLGLQLFGVRKWWRWWRVLLCHVEKDIVLKGLGGNDSSKMWLCDAIFVQT